MISKELYKFAENGREWTFTSSDSAEEYDGSTYEPVTLTRSEFESKNEMTRANLDVKFDLDNEFARRLLTNYADYVLSVSIFEKIGVETKVVWKGRLVSVKPSDTTIIFKFENFFTSMRRSGARRKYQKNCPFGLYNRGCNLNYTSFATPCTPYAVDEKGILYNIPEAGSFADHYFTGGMIEDAAGVLRLIINHVGSSITIQSTNLNLKNDTAAHGYGMNYGNAYGNVVANLYPGCDHLRSTCKDKFDNLDNYGGFPWMPGRNPIDGSSIL